MKRISLLVIVVCASCAPQLDPNGGASYYNALTTATVMAQFAQATAQPSTQSAKEYEYAQSLTQTFIPPALTATANSNIATQDANSNVAARATTESLDHQNALTVTMQALAVLESDTQARIADNNRAISESVYRANAMQWVWYGGAVVFVLILFGAALISLFYFQKGALVAKQVFERREWDKVEQEHAKKLFEMGLSPSSIGPMLLIQPSAPALAEKHVENYQRANNWRAILKTYVASCIELERGGVRQPFSRPNCLTYKLIQDPATERPWQLGHDRVIGLLRELKVIDNTGKGGSTRLVVDVGEFARVIDLSPLPNLPPDPIPRAKITVAGWQLSQENAG